MRPVAPSVTKIIVKKCEGATTEDSSVVGVSDTQHTYRSLSMDSCQLVLVDRIALDQRTHPHDQHE